jgi:hypothetical protein
MAAGWADDGGLSGRDQVFRLDRGFRKPLVTRGSTALAVAVLAAVLAVLGIAADAAWGFASLFGALALGYAARYVWAGRFRTRLSPEGIQIRGYFDHFVPWQDVAGLTVNGSDVPEQARLPAEPYQTASGAVSARYDSVRPGAGQLNWTWQLMNQADSTAGYRAKLATVRVTRTRGRPLLLRAPLVTAWQSDPDFEDKVRAIQRWWHAYGHGTVAPPSG